MRRPIRFATLVLVPGLALAACGDGGTPGGVCWTTSTPEQLAERPSPLDSTLVTLGDGQAKVCYGRPSARGREVMGALVRYDEPWRLGANEATSIHLPFPAEIGSVSLGAGSYSLYAIPGVDEWTVVVNGIVERWGIPIDEGVTSADLGAFTVPAEMLDSPVETFTVEFEEVGPGEAHLVASWESARIRIPVRRPEG